MSHTLRQFRALTKKNFISWYKQPCCALFQLICPGLLMLILVWIRTKIGYEDYGNIDYEGFKKPFFPGLEYLGGKKWSYERAKTSSR